MRVHFSAERPQHDAGNFVSIMLADTGWDGLDENTIATIEAV